jgi:hypothetical protein
LLSGWHQNSQLWQRIEALDEFKAMQTEGDGLGPLTAIKGQLFNFQS